MTVCDGGEGGGGVQNSFNLCDVIYVRPQRRSSLKRLVNSSGKSIAFRIWNIWIIKSWHN